MIEVHYDIVLDLYSKFLTREYGSRTPFISYAEKMYDISEHDATLIWQGFDVATGNFRLRDEE